MSRPLSPEDLARLHGHRDQKIREIPRAIETRGPQARIFRAGWVYFIRCHDFVKIGWTTNLPQRMTKFKTGNPYPLEFLFCIAADQSAEVRLHDEYREYHHRDEWFRLEGKLKEYVDG